MSLSDQLSILTVRQANIVDLDQLISLASTTFYDTFAAVNKPEDMAMYMESSFHPKQVRSELLDERNVFLIAESEGVAAGYAKVRKAEPPEELADAYSVEIERVYVSREFLGKRVGQALMDACLQLATDWGCDLVWLGVWERNARAIAFYEKYGFETFGQHPFVLGADHQTDRLMKKILRS